MLNYRYTRRRVKFYSRQCTAAAGSSCCNCCDKIVYSHSSTTVCTNLVCTNLKRGLVSTVAEAADHLFLLNVSDWVLDGSGTVRGCAVQANEDSEYVQHRTHVVRQTAWASLGQIISPGPQKSVCCTLFLVSQGAGNALHQRPAHPGTRCFESFRISDSISVL